MGWYMVMSGLVDIPRVSQYRLTAHLSLAFVIFGYVGGIDQWLDPCTNGLSGRQNE